MNWEMFVCDSLKKNAMGSEQCFKSLENISQVVIFKY